MDKEGFISEEEARQLWAEIENEGLGYWVLEYGYDGSDSKLIELNNKAKEAMRALREHLQKTWDNYEIG